MVDKALSLGATRVAVGRVRWDISGRCQRPHVTEIYSRPSGDEGKRFIRYPAGKSRIVVTRSSMVPMTLELHTPCRRCDSCKFQRQRLWTARAIDETRLAARTWFGTLTLRPEAWLHAVNQCRAKEAIQGVDFDALPEAERLALIHARTGAEVTKMLKRLRFNLGPDALRHLVVLEVTKAGVLHYHCLLHETDASRPLRHVALKDQWPLGFSKWKLVKDEYREDGTLIPAHVIAGYVAKYLSKSLLARVRASEAYGSGGKTGTEQRPSDIAAHQQSVKTLTTQTP